MKKNSIILKIAKVLAVILISLIAFVGIYVQKTNRMENIVKDYKYNMDLEGRRVISLKVSDEKETIIKDAEGNKVEEELTDEEISQKGYSKEEIPNNKEDVLTEENYEKSKNIIEKRLEKLNINNYIIRLDEVNGTIYLEIPENNKTDHTVSNISEMGKFEIIDDNDKTVLINNEQLKSAKVLYNTESTGTIVYLSMEFTKEGKEKLSEISKTYVKTESNTNETEETTEEQNNENAENTTEEANNENEENATESTENNTSEETDTTEEKKVTLQIDENAMITTSFDEPIENGTIQLSMGAASSDKEEIEDTAEKATTIATLINNGNLPIKYQIDENKYVTSDFNKETIQQVIIAIAIAILIGLVLLSVKYKSKGLFASVSFIGFIAICSLIIRYTNVIITLNSIVAMIIVILLNFAFNIKILSKIKNQNDINKKIKESYKEFFMKIMPVIIISIVFSFINWVPISSFGMSLIWGLAIIAIYNILVTKNFIK